MTWNEFLAIAFFYAFGSSAPGEHLQRPTVFAPDLSRRQVESTTDRAEWRLVAAQLGSADAFAVVAHHPGDPASVTVHAYRSDAAVAYVQEYTMRDRRPSYAGPVTVRAEEPLPAAPEGVSAMPLWRRRLGNRPFMFSIRARALRSRVRPKMARLAMNLRTEHQTAVHRYTAFDATQLTGDIARFLATVRREMEAHGLVHLGDFEMDTMARDSQVVTTRMTSTDGSLFAEFGGQVRDVAREGGSRFVVDVGTALEDGRIITTTSMARRHAYLDLPDFHDRAFLGDGDEVDCGELLRLHRARVGTALDATPTRIRAVTSHDAALEVQRDISERAGLGRRLSGQELFRLMGSRYDPGTFLLFVDALASIGWSPHDYD